MRVPLPVGKVCCAHRQGDGEIRFPHMFTSVIHAAAPHNDKMKMGFSWEGVALPNPPRWRVVSWEGVGAAPPRLYAQTLPRAGYFHLRTAPCLPGARHRPI